MYDVLIIGDGLAGPAALAHAIERGLDAVLVSSCSADALARRSVCAPDGSMSVEHHAVAILKRWVAQHAGRVTPDHILALTRFDDGFLATSAGQTYAARSVIIATSGHLDVVPDHMRQEDAPPGLFLADAIGEGGEQSLIAIGRGTLAALRAYDYLTSIRQRGGLAERELG